MSTPLEVTEKNEEKFEDSMALVQADKLLHPREYIRSINNDNTLALLQALYDELEGKKKPLIHDVNWAEGYNAAIQKQQDNLQALMNSIRV